MKRVNRTSKQLKSLSKRVIKYYFDNPIANSYKDIEKKFNVGEARIRKILTDELENRFKKRHSNKCINELED